MTNTNLIDRDRIIEILQELVAIPSVNPEFPGGTNELAVSEYVEDFFKKLNINYEKQKVDVDRYNVIGKIDGNSKDENYLFEAHMDTVQVTNMTIPPFKGEVKDGKLYGRGACDTKGSLAGMLAVMEILKKQNITPTHNLHLAAVVDEEYNFGGVKKLAEEIKNKAHEYKGAIVGEPTSLNIVNLHKGTIKYKVSVEGVTGHTSKPSQGINAISKMVHVLNHLKSMEDDFESKKHPVLGPPTQSFTIIEGGVGPNTIPGSCELSVDRRTVPTEDPWEVWEDIKLQLEELQKTVPQLKLKVHEPFILNYSLETKADHPVISDMKKAAEKAKINSDVGHVHFGSDGSYLNKIGIPSIVIGPGSIEQAHTADEWVLIDEVIQYANLLLNFVTD